MRFEFKPSFERSIRQLPDKEKQEIKEVAIQLVDILSRDQHISKGIGCGAISGRRAKGSRQGSSSAGRAIWRNLSSQGITTIFDDFLKMSDEHASNDLVTEEKIMKLDKNEKKLLVSFKRGEWKYHPSSQRTSFARP